MLSSDVRFSGFTFDDWSRFLSLFKPHTESGAPRDPARPQGAIVAVTRAGRLVKLLHSQAGRLRTEDVAPVWPLSAEALAERHHASFAAVLTDDVLSDVMEQFGARIRQSDDGLDQLLMLASILEGALHSGQLSVFPSRLSGLPIPSRALVDRTLDAVCPRGNVVVVGLFDGASLYTSIACKRGPTGCFSDIMGPDAIRSEIGLLAGDWRRDQRHLAGAIERRLGPISMGVFSEVGTWNQLLVSAEKGAWAKAVAVRDVILSPLPPALVVPLGIDASRAAIGFAKEAAIRGGALTYLEDPRVAAGLSLMRPFLSLARDSAIAALGEAKGPDEARFDLLLLIRRLIARDR